MNIKGERCHDAGSRNHEEDSHPLPCVYKCSNNSSCAHAKFSIFWSNLPLHAYTLWIHLLPIYLSLNRNHCSPCIALPKCYDISHFYVFVQALFSTWHAPSVFAEVPHIFQNPTQMLPISRNLPDRSLKLICLPIAPYSFKSYYKRSKSGSYDKHVFMHAYLATCALASLSKEGRKKQSKGGTTGRGRRKEDGEHLLGLC